MRKLSEGQRLEAAKSRKRFLILSLIEGFILALLMGCSQAPRLKEAPPAPVIAKVAIPVPCEIEQVPVPAYPGDLATLNDDIWTAARLVLADRRVRIAEGRQLRAANSADCTLKDPAVPKP